MGLIASQQNHTCEIRCRFDLWAILSSPALEGRSCDTLYYRNLDLQPVQFFFSTPWLQTPFNSPHVFSCVYWHHVPNQSCPSVCKHLGEYTRKEERCLPRTAMSCFFDYLMWSRFSGSLRELKMGRGWAPRTSHVRTCRKTTKLTSIQGTGEFCGSSLRYGMFLLWRSGATIYVCNAHTCTFIGICFHKSWIDTVLCHP